MMVKGALPEVFDSGEGLSGGGDVHAEECFMGQSLPVALGHAQAGHLVSRVKLLLLQILKHGRRLRKGGSLKRIMALTALLGILINLVICEVLRCRLHLYFI